MALVDTLLLNQDDDMFMFAAVERDFSVKLPVDRPYNTVGDIFDAVVEALNAAPVVPTTTCFSMIAFHRLRKGVRHVRPDIARINLNLDLSNALTPAQQRALKAHVESTHRLVLDGFVLTKLGLGIAVSVFFASLAAFLAWFWSDLNGWYLTGGLLLATVLSLASTTVLPQRLQDEATVRRLVRRTTARNIGRLVREYGMPRERDLWRAFSDSLAESLDRNLDGLHRGTRLAW